MNVICHYSRLIEKDKFASPKNNNKNEFAHCYIFRDLAEYLFLVDS